VKSKSETQMQILHRRERREPRFFTAERAEIAELINSKIKILEQNYEKMFACIFFVFGVLTKI
jgi:hypothetical protein